MAYFKVEPFGSTQLNCQLGLIAATVASQYRKNIKIEDFVLGRYHPPAQKQSDPEIARDLLQVFKGKLISKAEWKKRKRKKKKKKRKDNAT